MGGTHTSYTLAPLSLPVERQQADPIRIDLSPSRGNVNVGRDLSGNQWRASGVLNGVRDVFCDSWSGYVSFLNEVLLDYRSYIFRGHTSDTWKLESTLDRVLKHVPSNERAAKRTKHLENFKYASRGRRGLNPAMLTTDNDWWALGQHHGLATPLLDWTESPYVAAYFAVCSPSQDTTNRIVFALSRISVGKVNNELQKAKRLTSTLQLFKPMSDENQRVINQRGLFTKAPNGQSIEQWIEKHFAGSTNGAKLLRISIPNSDRAFAMKSLNRMNINHLSLFPDVYGAAKYCNHELQIDRY